MAVDLAHADALAEIETLRVELAEMRADRDAWRADRNELARLAADLRDELNTVRGATGGPVAVALWDLIENLAGIAELATELGVPKQTLCNWRTRNADFPGAVVVLASGSVYDRREVAVWRADHLAAP